MKAIVDAETCTGCELCVDICPEVFEMGEDEVALVLVDSIPAENEAVCRDAADQCPSDAIQIEE